MTESILDIILTDAVNMPGEYMINPQAYTKFCRLTLFLISYQV